MEKKLELRHLAAYLPYGLKICYRILDLENGDPTTGNPEDRLMNCIMVMDGARLDRCLLPETDRWYDKNSVFKPLLIPLSDMTPEQWDVYCDIDEQRYRGCRFNPLIHHTDAVMFLFANHFDVFGLIDSGLALNKLTTPH